MVSGKRCYARLLALMAEASYSMPSPAHFGTGKDVWARVCTCVFSIRGETKLKSRRSGLQNKGGGEAHEHTPSSIKTREGNAANTETNMSGCT